jgi:type II secretory pathway component GspD/PulD (secretin)
MPVLLVLCCIGTLRAEEAKPKVEMRIYDVRDLTTVLSDFPVPPVLLHDAAASGVANPFDAQPAQETTLATIAETIRNRVAPESWDAGLGTSIEERFGQLIVLQTAEKHTLIQQLLSSLRQYSKAHVIVRAKLVSAPQVSGPTHYTPEALAELLDPKKGAQVLAAPRLICGNTQLSHVLSGRKFSFVQDLDVSGQMMDPVVRTAVDGYALEVRPALSSDRMNVTLDLKFQLGTQPDRGATRGVSYASPVLAHGPEKALPEMRNEIETPSLGTSQVSTQVVLSAGKWMLAAVMKNPNRDAKNKHLLLFITAEAAEKNTAGKPMTLGLVQPAPLPAQPATPAAAAPVQAPAENF